MCMIFTENCNEPKLLAKNYDCFIDEGMLFTNRRGMKKASLVMPPKRIFEWTSQYGSVTFSQSGKGMPSCGVNEKGLIVEQATVLETVYSTDESKAEISCLEATQYLLDTCKDIDEAINGFDKFNIGQTSGKVHFFILDKTGKSVIIEYLEGQKKVYKIDEGLPLITNSPYEMLCKGKQNFTSEYEENSFMRYEIAKKELSKEKELTVERAFEILEKGRRQDTIWQIVYDNDKNKIHFIAGGNAKKTIDLTIIDYSDSALSYMYDLNERQDEFVWQPYTREMNRKCIEGFYSHPAILKVFNLPDAKFIIDAFDEHIERIEQNIL